MRRFLPLQVVTESVGSLSSGYGLIAVPEVFLHLAGYSDSAAFVVYPGIRLSRFYYHTVTVGYPPRDATAQDSGTDEQSPALVVVKFAACPLLIEEGFALKVPVKLIQSFCPYVFQCLPYQQVDAPLEVTGYLV